MGNFACASGMVACAMWTTVALVSSALSAVSRGHVHAATSRSGCHYTRRAATGLARDAVLFGGVVCGRPARALAAVTEADVAYAVADIAAAKAAVQMVENLAFYEEYRDARPLTAKPPLSSFGVNTHTLGEGPGLSSEQKDSVASVREEVLESLRDLADSLRAEDRRGVRKSVRRAEDGLNQILAACRAAGLY